MSQNENQELERTVPTLNSPFEAGIRAVVLLRAAWPSLLNLDRLTLFDHALTHGEDLNVGISISPKIPVRVSGLAARRNNLRAGLALFARTGLVDVLDGDQGISYRAGEGAASFVDLLETSHASSLKAQANRVVEQLGGMSDEGVASAIAELVGSEVARLRAGRDGGE